MPWIPVVTADVDRRWWSAAGRTPGMAASGQAS